MKKIILALCIILLLILPSFLMIGCKKDEEEEPVAEDLDAYGFQRPVGWSSDILLLNSAPNMAELIGTGGDSGLLSDLAQTKNGVGLKSGETAYFVYLFYARMNEPAQIDVTDFQFKLVSDGKVTYGTDCVTVGNPRTYTKGAGVNLDMTKSKGDRMDLGLTETRTESGSWVQQGAIVVPFTVKSAGMLYIDFCLNYDPSVTDDTVPYEKHLCAEIGDLPAANCMVNVHSFSVGYLPKDAYENATYTDEDVTTVLSFDGGSTTYMVVDFVYSAAGENDGVAQLNMLVGMPGRGKLDVTVDAAPTGKVTELKTAEGISISASFNVPPTAGEQRTVRVFLRLLALGNGTTDLDLFLCGTEGVRVSGGTYLTESVQTQSNSLLNYQINSDGMSYSVTGITDKTVTSVEIPAAREDGVPVTAIGASAFNKCENLQNITIPSDIVSIGASAFNGCNKLSYYVFENGKYLGNRTNPCVALMGVSDKTATTFTVAQQTRIIYVGAFSGCTALTGVTLPDSIVQIGNQAFLGCTGLLEIVIPAGIKTIASETFSGCTALERVTMPEGVVSIGANAFNGCVALVNVSLPSTVEEISTSAFSGCEQIAYTVYENGRYLGGAQNPYLLFDGAVDTSVATFNIHANTRFIWDSALLGCGALTSIVIPEDVRMIGEGAFAGCAGLTSVTIPEKVTTIGENAFYECAALTSVTIPPSVGLIGVNAFYGCTALTGVYISDVAPWCKADLFKNGLGNAPYSNPLFYAKKLYLNGNLVTDLVIPDGVTVIGRNAFYGCESIKSVSFPQGLTTIGYKSFVNCIGIENLVIPEGVVKFSTSFAGCTSLKSVTLPSTLTDCYGDSYVSWGDSGTLANFTGCKNLTEVHISDLAAWCQIDFGWISTSNPLFYADSLYLNGELVTEVVVPAGVTEIGTMAFHGYSALTSVTLPSDVVTIGDGAFGACKNLKNVTISSGIQTIGESAFRDCKALTQIAIPYSVTKIEAMAFSGCSALGSAEFERTSGWTYGATGAAAKTIHFTSASEAADYLKEEYSGKVWYNS